VLDHLSIQCANVATSAAFYDAALSALGAERVMEIGSVIGYGVAGRGSFWLSPLVGDRPNRELHVAFRAADRAAVRAFYEAGVGVGAEVLHEPRRWPEYHPDYYGAFLRDPDGNNVEAVCHTPE
jgi:catechol 2,3-dioxygenase-like lactoylglutathione lyase family enzyme